MPGASKTRCSGSDDIVGDWHLSAPAPDDTLLGRDGARPVHPASIGCFADFALEGEFAETQRGEPVLAEQKTRIRRRTHVENDSHSVCFPDVGNVLAGFQLVSELGRGAFARVYLAQQLQLANRQVALKVSEALGDEPQALARLQHAHIVPIHSVHDDPQSGFRLLCMPYLGGANLAQVLQFAGHAHFSHTQGRSLIDALDALEAEHPAADPSTAKSSSQLAAQRHPTERLIHRSRTRVRDGLGRYFARLSLSGGERSDDASQDGMAVHGARCEQPARRFYFGNSFVRTSVWIIARLAEALEHAHTRGILHRDLKPSNVLIAADGTPMLLDFNLAENVSTLADDAPRAHAGGTLPYMAPEHLDAFSPRGATKSSAVDERSDIYSLGLIFYEMLAGEHPFADPEMSLPLVDALDRMIEERRRGAARIRSVNGDVPPSLQAVLDRCLAFDPGRRYASAAHLAEDLRRFLDDRPMKYAGEPSLRERFSKWRRRHPELRSSTTIGVTAVALIALTGLVAWSVGNRLEGASAILQRNRFADQFQRAQLLLNTSNGPESHLPEGVALATEALKTYGISSSALPGAWHSQAALGRLPRKDQRALREQLSELLILRARAQVRLAGGSPGSLRRDAFQSALGALDIAEKIDSAPSAALYLDRAQYERALNLQQKAAASEVRAAELGVVGARDCYLVGTALAATGQNDAAIEMLTRAVALDGRRFWAYFVLGLCHYDLGQYAEAAADFSVCTVLSPEFAWPQLNRGLALAAAGKSQAARICYDRAIELAPDFLEAHVNRALVCLQLDEPEQALRDLDFAREHDPGNADYLPAYAEALARNGQRDEAELVLDNAIGRAPDDIALLTARGLVRLQRGDRDAARLDLTRAFELEPHRPRVRVALAHLLRETDPDKAIQHLDSALTAEPARDDALQLRALIRARQGDLRAEADVDALVARPTPLNLYNGACALAILATKTDTDRTLPRAALLLRRALSRGVAVEHARRDEDLAGLRRRSEYRDLFEHSG